MGLDTKIYWVTVGHNIRLRLRQQSRIWQNAEEEEEEEEEEEVNQRALENKAELQREGFDIQKELGVWTVITECVSRNSDGK
jgi:hypothetical protein